jgi:ribosome maturation factor RimP
MGCFSIGQNMGQKEEIKKLIEPIFDREGYDLIEIKLGRFKQTSRMQLFADSAHGITIDECARLSRLVEPVLESESVFSGPYIVEISSPGLDRPLVTGRDFARKVGNRVEIYMKDEESKMAGVLVSSDDDTIEIKTDDDTVTLSISDIKHGIIVI